jgi:hypothetical protein
VLAKKTFSDDDKILSISGSTGLSPLIRSAVSTSLSIEISAGSV